MSSTCFKLKGVSSGRHIYIQLQYGMVAHKIMVRYLPYNNCIYNAKKNNQNYDGL